MPASAFFVYKSLRESGIDEGPARKAAEVVDAQADRNVENQAETNAHFDRLRADIAGFSRRVESFRRVCIGLQFIVVGGFAVVIAKLFELFKML